MLRINELENFTKNTLNLFPDTIEAAIVVVDDNDVALFSKDISTEKKILLVAVLPSSRPASSSSDQVEFDSMGSFMFLKKRDRDCYSEYLNKMKAAESAAIEFVGYLTKIKNQELAQPNGYKNIQFPSLATDPVSNFKGYCGFSVDFTTKNHI